MNKSLFLLLVLLLTSCGSSWNVSTLNHDPIYQDENYINVEVLNDFQVRHKLRTDFNFRYNIAQYALSQPASFDWNNRLLGNRYNWNRPYWGYSYYWDRTQMWNDWVWGITPHRWSPFGYDRWGYNSYGWNNYGWNSWGWNGYYGNNWGWRQQMNNYAWNNRYRRNTVYVNGYRTSIKTSTRTVSNNRRVNVNQDNVDIIASEIRRKVNKPRINNPRPRINNPRPTINNNSRPRINNNPRQPSTIRTTPRTSSRPNSSTTVRSNSRRKN